MRLVVGRTRDYHGAIVIAASAEELLSDAVTGLKLQTALEERARFMARLSGRGDGEAAMKSLRDYLNYPRNALKHHAVGNRTDLAFDAEMEAINMIERALSNYRRAFGDSPNSKIFYRYWAIHHRPRD